MLLYDIVQDARTILIDTREPYRWSDEFFSDRYNDMVNILWSSKPSLFLDDLGRVQKQIYKFSLPSTRGTAVALGSLCHESSGDIYECTIAGTTGVTEPTWNPIYGSLTVDGTATYKAIERSDLPFPDFTRIFQSAFLISKAYEIDSTEESNASHEQRYFELFKGIYQ